MNNSITNTANASGTFDSLLTGLSQTIVTAMTEDLSITKTADKVMWADGNLTYTITISNASEDLPYENVTFSDVIEPTLAVLVENSVRLNGTLITYQYVQATGLLTVEIGDVEPLGSAVITFEISKR